MEGAKMKNKITTEAPAPRRATRYGKTERVPGMRWLMQTIADAKVAAERMNVEFTKFVEDAVIEKLERVQK